MKNVFSNIRILVCLNTNRHSVNILPPVSKKKIFFLSRVKTENHWLFYYSPSNLSFLSLSHTHACVRTFISRIYGIKMKDVFNYPDFPYQSIMKRFYMKRFSHKKISQRQIGGVIKKCANTVFKYLLKYIFLHFLDEIS